MQMKETKQSKGVGRPSPLQRFDVFCSPDFEVV